MASAVEGLREGITISDALLPDNPIVYANVGFMNMTGYSLDEILGKNCRYLQGPDTDGIVVNQIAEGIKNKKPVMVELLNYTKLGVPFWNHLSVSPLINKDGEVTHYVGIQDDITNLRKAKSEKLEEERKVEIAKALLNGEEQEKKRIGLELHDNISQLLGTVKLYINLARDRTMNTMALNKSEEVIESAIAETRRLSHQLVKVPLTDDEFISSVSELLSSVKVSSGIITKFNCDQNDLLISDEAKLNLYRIIQEQLNNILKHAHASSIEVNLMNDNGMQQLTISDDGIGFDPSFVAHGIGLQNMETRAKAMNGILRITSQKGGGTTLTLLVVPKSNSQQI